MGGTRRTWQALILLPALSCSETAAPRLESVAPPVVSNVAPATVALIGTGLTAVPTVDLDQDDPPVVDGQFAVQIGTVELEAQLVEAGRVEVTLPAGFPIGTYDVTVSTPARIDSTLESALTVTDENVRGCFDDGDCLDPCRSGAECVDNVCVLDPPDNPLCTVGQPTLIAELSDASADDRAPTVTGDLLEIYFQSNRDQGNDTDIWRSTRGSVSDAWSAPERVAELSTGERDDSAPEISRDGLTIYLSSNRDQPNQRDIYVATRPDRSAPWSSPQRVPELSSDERDEHATPDSSNLRMITRRGDLFEGDLFETSRLAEADPWNEPQPITELNTPDSDSSGFLEGDGLILWMASERPGGASANDLWIATRQTLSRPFFAPELVAPVSGSGHDLDPWIAADGSYLVFSSDRDGNFDLYEAR